MLSSLGLIQAEESSHYLRRMVTTMNTLLSVLKDTQFNKHLVSIYYVPCAAVRAYGSAINKTWILTSKGYGLIGKTISHSITVQEAKGVGRKI